MHLAPEKGRKQGNSQLDQLRLTGLSYWIERLDFIY